MQKASALFLILFLGFSVMVFAQDESVPDVEQDWDDFKYELYSEGDQTFSISLGVGFPIAFFKQGEKVEKHNIEPPIGGTGALSYTYYLNSHLFLGGDLSLLFLPTISENTVFITSMGAKIGTQFILGKFEFPISMALTYLDFGYFGFFMKAGASAFYRANHEWSFGLASNFCWYPQWTKKEPSKNIDALFADLTLVARYHF